jgi:hypothetical protein
VRSLPPNIQLNPPHKADVHRASATDYLVTRQGRTNNRRGGASCNPSLPPPGFVAAQAPVQPAAGAPQNQWPNDADWSQGHDKVPAREHNGISISAKPRFFFYRLPQGTLLPAAYNHAWDTSQHGLIFPRANVTLAGPHIPRGGHSSLHWSKFPDWDESVWEQGGICIQATDAEYNFLRGAADVFDPPPPPEDPSVAQLLWALHAFAEDAPSQDPYEMNDAWSLWHELTLGKHAKAVCTATMDQLLAELSAEHFDICLCALTFQSERTESDEVEVVRQKLSDAWFRRAQEVDSLAASMSGLHVDEEPAIAVIPATQHVKIAFHFKTGFEYGQDQLEKVADGLMSPMFGTAAWQHSHSDTVALCGAITTQSVLMFLAVSGDPAELQSLSVPAFTCSVQDPAAEKEHALGVAELDYVLQQVWSRSFNAGETVKLITQAQSETDSQASLKPYLVTLLQKEASAASTSDIDLLVAQFLSQLRTPMQFGKPLSSLSSVNGCQLVVFTAAGHAPHAQVFWDLLSDAELWPQIWKELTISRSPRVHNGAVGASTGASASADASAAAVLTTAPQQAANSPTAAPVTSPAALSDPFDQLVSVTKPTATQCLGKTLKQIRCQKRTKHPMGFCHMHVLQWKATSSNTSAK